eukprot:131324-Amphidinium_carterae.1
MLRCRHAWLVTAGIAMLKKSTWPQWLDVCVTCILEHTVHTYITSRTSDPAKNNDNIIFLTCSNTDNFKSNLKSQVSCIDSNLTRYDPFCAKYRVSHLRCRRARTTPRTTAANAAAAAKYATSRACKQHCD